MIEVHEEQDGSFTITWNENDPLESQLNHWTEEDFINAIMEGIKKNVQQTNQSNQQEETNS